MLGRDRDGSYNLCANENFFDFQLTLLVIYRNLQLKLAITLDATLTFLEHSTTQNFLCIIIC